MSNDDLLLLAYNLAILTYSLGVAIYALPIPLKSVKKWGVGMMYDAISAAILVSSFSLIAGLANYILNLLNADWNTFIAWISGRTAVIFTAFSTLTYIGGLLRNPLMGFLSSPINIVLGYLSAALSAIKALFFLGSFIQVYYKHLILLGTLLYSLPFRVGKNAGAYLISFALVFYTCMPLMPAFVETFQQASSSVSMRSTEISGYVVDYLGNPVPNVILNLYDDEVLVASILTDSLGRYVLGGEHDVLPRNFSYTISLELYGFTLYVIPEVINDRTCGNMPRCYLNLSVLGLIIGPMGKIAVLRPHTVSITGANVVDGLIELALHSSAGSNELLVVYPMSTYLDSISVDGIDTSCSYKHKYEWRSIDINVCGLNIRDGHTNVAIRYEGKAPIKPSVSEKRLVALEDLTAVIVDLITLGMGFIFSLVFLPSLYLVLLLSVSASLARVLGGRGLSIKVF